MPLYNPFKPPEAPTVPQEQPQERRRKNLTLKQMLGHADPKIRRAARQAVQVQNAFYQLNQAVQSGQSPETFLQSNPQVQETLNSVGYRPSAPEAGTRSDFWNRPEFREDIAEYESLQRAAQRYETARNSGVSVQEFMRQYANDYKMLQQAGILPGGSSTPKAPSVAIDRWTKMDMAESGLPPSTAITEKVKAMTPTPGLPDKIARIDYEEYKSSRVRYVGDLNRAWQKYQIGGVANLTPKEVELLQGVGAFGEYGPNSQFRKKNDDKSRTALEIATSTDSAAKVIGVDNYETGKLMPFRELDPQKSWWESVKDIWSGRDPEIAEARDAFVESGMPKWKVALSLHMQKLLRTGGRSLQFFDTVSSIGEEYVAAGDNLTVAGTFMNYGLNLLLLGQASARESFYSIFDEEYWQNQIIKAKIRHQATRTQLNDPARIAQYEEQAQKELDRIQTRIDDARDAKAYRTRAETAAFRALELFERARRETPDPVYGDPIDIFNPATQGGTDLNPFDVTEEEILNPYSIESQKYFEGQEAIRQQAARDARTLRNRSIELLNQSNELVNSNPEKAFELYNESLEAMMQAHKQEALSDPYDPTWSYSWREKDRKEAFDRNYASAELQMGRPLNELEIRELKSYYENVWTQLSGDFIFDLTNLAPVGLLVDTFKLLKPSRALTKVDEVLQATSASLKASKYVKTAKFIDAARSIEFPILSYLTRQTTNAVATHKANLVQDIFTRLAPSYDNASKFVEDIGRIAKYVEDLRGLKMFDKQAALDAFARAQDEIQSLRGVTFDEFNGLVDMADDAAGGIKFQDWATMYDNAVKESVEVLRDDLYVTVKKSSRRGASIEEISSEVTRRLNGIINTPSQNGMAMGIFAQKFAGAYTDFHRIYKGASLLDDTISGQIVLFFRKLADDVTEGSQVRKIFKDVMEKGERGIPMTISEKINRALASGAGKRLNSTKNAMLQVARFIEWSVKAGKFVTDVWSMFVLSLNPRWIVQNYIDSSFRALIHGTNPFNGLFSMNSSLYRDMVDEMGFLPAALNQSGLRDGLSYTSSIPVRMVYGKWKQLPGPLSILSYYKYEYQRLAKLGKQAAEGASVEAVKAVAQRFPPGSVWEKIANTMGGARMAFEAVPGAMQDLNASIEFGLRLRMFHKEYFKNIQRLKPLLDDIGMDSMSPGLRKLASQLSYSAGSNPQKLTALIESVLLNKADSSSVWSTIIPPNLEKHMTALTPSERHILVSDIRSQLEVMVDSIYKSGRKPSAEDFKSFFDEVLEDTHDTINTQISNSHPLKEIDDTIGTQQSKIPGVDEVKVRSAVLEREDVDAALKRIQPKKQPFVKFQPDKSFDDYRIAMADTLPVELVPGNGQRIVKMRGETTIQIGEDVIKNLRTTAELNSYLNEQTIKAFIVRESEFALDAGFSSVQEFDDAFRLFINAEKEGPLALYTRNQDHFFALVQEFEANPDLRTILERTSGKAINYEYAWKNYMRNVPLNKIHGQAWLDMLQQMADEVHVPPAHVRHAALRHQSQVLELQRRIEIKSLGPQLENEVRNYLAMYDTARKDLGQFFLWSDPGPKTLSGVDRSKSWDDFFWRQAEGYEYGEKLHQSILKMIDENPGDALEYLRKFNSNFYDNFLENHGITDFKFLEGGPVEISNFKITRGDKTYEISGELARHDLYERFLSPEKKSLLKSSEILDVGSRLNMTLDRELYQYAMDSFNLTKEQAQTYSRIIKDHVDAMVLESGRNADFFLKRMGFVRVDGHLQATDALRMSQKSFDEFGRVRMYGFGARNATDLIRQTSILFYQDLKFLAGAQSATAAEDLRRLHKFLEDATGKKVIKGQLKDEHIQAFADAFQRYIMLGEPPTASLRKPFNRFSTWMNRVNANALQSPLKKEMPEDVVELMDRMFTLSKVKAPESAKRTVRLMAREAGVEFKSSQQLLDMINESVSPLKKNDKASLRAQLLVTGRPEEEIEATLSLLEYRARAWGAWNKKNPSDYFKDIQIYSSREEEFNALYQMFEKLPTTADRRTPAFAQLRNMWDTLTDEERREVFFWLTEQTLVDPLSGLETIVAKTMSNKPEGWVEAISDLNALKAINDTWGHGAGDTIIEGIGRIAKEEVEAVGGRVFRTGGDEMSYWFPDRALAEQTMKSIDERILTQTFNVGDAERIGFSISYGIDETAALADKALYDDKVLRISTGQRSIDRGQLPTSIHLTSEKPPKAAKVEPTLADVLASDGRLPNTNTREFKEWFLNSKLVDKDGKPIILYHGTKGNFQVFDLNAPAASDSGFYGKGIYLSPDSTESGFYSMKRTPKSVPENMVTIPSGTLDNQFEWEADIAGSNVMPVYVSLQNPFETWDMATMKRFGNTSDEITENLKRAGYDGVIVWRAEQTPKGWDDHILNEIVAFDSRQVKSVFNQGTFDISNPNILKQDYGYGRIESKNVNWTDDMLENFAEKLARDNDVRGVVRALEDESDLATRQRLLTKIRKHNKELAETVAARNIHMLRQEDVAAGMEQFYLKSRELIKQSFPSKGSMPVDQVRNWLMGRGISKDEMFWSGLDERLSLSKSLTKEELLEWSSSHEFTLMPSRKSTSDIPEKQFPMRKWIEEITPEQEYRFGPQIPISEPDFRPSPKSWIKEGRGDNASYYIDFPYATKGLPITSYNSGELHIEKRLLNGKMQWDVSEATNFNSALNHGLQDPTPKQLMEYIQQNGVTLQRYIENTPSGISTKYHELRLFGDFDDYSETVMRVKPYAAESGSQALMLDSLKSGHFDYEGYLYHIRSQVVSDGDSKVKVLLELQNDLVNNPPYFKGKQLPAPLESKYKEQGLRQLVREAVDEGATRVAWISDVDQLSKIEGWNDEAFIVAGIEGVSETKAAALLKFYTEDLPKTVQKTFKQFNIEIKQAKVNGELLNYFDITPEMRASLFKAESIFQRKGGKILGGYWKENGKRILGIFEGANASTLPHEIWHMFMDELKTDDLRVDDLRIIEKITGLEPGEFTSLRPVLEKYRELKQTGADDALMKALEPDALRYEKAEEMFANGGLRYLREGKSPIPELTPIFEKFKQWLSEIWRWVRQQPSIELTDEVRGVYDRFFELPHGQVAEPIRYTNFSEVPHDMAARVFKSAASQQIVDNMNAAFDVWKLRHELVGIPDDALKNFDAAKAYVRQQFENTSGELSNQYRLLMWQFEQFEDAMLENMMKHGFINRIEKVVGDFIAPTVTKAHMHGGSKTFMRNGIYNRAIYDSVEGVLQEWRRFLATAVDTDQLFPILTKDEIRDLKEWGKQAIQNKAKMVDLAINGGTLDNLNIEGAMEKTNGVMLDYQNRNNFDQIMKNLFPFWMFPSRSLPFWTKTLMTHPQIISLYQKFKRLSESSAYQAGAVTSSGKPLPSMEGYIPIPGLDIWINPMAAFSFRYILDMPSYANDMMYKSMQAKGESDDNAYHAIGQTILEVSPIFGFSFGPWVNMLMKAGGFETQQWSIVPHSNLIPPWWFPEFIQRSEMMMNLLAPEPKWHDFLVDRYLLEKANQYISNPALTDDQRKDYLTSASKALQEREKNPMWNEAYQTYVLNEKDKNLAAFFTGFYPKEFSDAQADLFQLRNEVVLMQSAMNNNFQAHIFKIPLEEQKRWDYYRSRYRVDVPEGWLYNLYGDISWVTNSENKIVSDPNERAKLVAARIDEDNSARAYFQKAHDLELWKNRELSRLAIGATWEETERVYDYYYAQKERLDDLLPDYKYMGSNKPVSLIEKDIRNLWWSEISKSRPTWSSDTGETYEHYESRLSEWETNLPKNAALYMKYFQRNKQVMDYLRYLDVDQPLDSSKLFESIILESTPVNYSQWKLQNDDVFTALNAVWKENYWNKYWDYVSQYKNEERKIAEMDFFEKNPVPDANVLYQWMKSKYGDRFTEDDIARWANFDMEDDRLKINSVTGRHEQEVGKEGILREKVWDMLSWMGPSDRQKTILENQFVQLGGDKNDIQDWYNAAPFGGAWKDDPDKLEEFHDRIQKAALALGAKPPNRMQLQQYIQARNQNTNLQQLVDYMLIKDMRTIIARLESDPNVEFSNKTIEGILDYNRHWTSEAYYTKQQIRKWKSQNRDIVKFVDAYYNIRNQYGRTHPLWAAYYQWKPKPPTLSNVGPDAQGYTPPSTGNGYSIVSAPQLNLPPGMANSVSPQLLTEMKSLYSSGTPLSSSARNYLYQLRQTHPEWRTFIDKILSSR